MKTEILIWTWGGSIVHAMPAGAHTIDLGAKYSHIRVWSDSGSSTYRLNFGTAATAAMAKFDDAMAPQFDFAREGEQYVYVYGDGSTGNLNVMYWN